jgi:hypothetical protein
MPARQITVRSGGQPAQIMAAEPILFGMTAQPESATGRC